MSTITTLVLGGTGKTGKRVAERLSKLNQPVRIGSRNANPKFDWDDHTTWTAALKDISKVYITFQPDLAVPGTAEKIQSFVNKAAAYGVEKLVLLSGRGEKEAQRCEEIVMSSRVDSTVVRASWFNQNFSENFFLDSILAGYVALPTNGVVEPFVDAGDIADVVVAALTTKGHEQKIYEVTGPRLMTFEQAVNEISQAVNSPIKYQDKKIEEYTAMLRSYHTPEESIALVEYLFTEVLDGRNGHISHGVEQVLGRKPTDFSDYVKRTAATGIWLAVKP